MQHFTENQGYSPQLWDEHLSRCATFEQHTALCGLLHITSTNDWTCLTPHKQESAASLW